MKFNGKDITELLALNRRNFIKFMVGGAAGTALSPIPWKLADDVAIFSQNFPWVPVPQTGEFIHEKTVCTLCKGGCGIEVRKVGDRAVKIEGRTDYPVNPGGICPVGMGGLQLLYDETLRFPGPMKRTGPRESGQYTRITWNEAIQILADHIKGLKNRGSMDTLAVVDGHSLDSTKALMVKRLTSALGSPNYMRAPSAEDTFRLAGSLMLGCNGPMAFDLENSDFILSFGSGLLEGWGSPGRVIEAWRIWRDGDPKNRKTKIVQVESRASNTASKSDQWIAAKPGTEAALALGLAHVIIKEGYVDQNFIDNYSFGFTEWRSETGEIHAGFRDIILKDYALDRVSEITSVPAKNIISLALDFARAKNPVALCGKGKGNLNGSVLEYMSIIALNGIVGSINRRGGLLIREPLPLNNLPNMGYHSEGEGFSSEQNNMTIFAEKILNADKSPIDTLMVFSANPAYTQPDGGAFFHAMQKIPFIVSFSPFHDESADMADLVLPDHTCLEKMDEIIWPSGLQYPLYGLTKPVVDPVYDTMNSGDTIIKLAKKIGGAVGEAFPWKKYEDVLETRAKGLYDSGTGLTSKKGSDPPWKLMEKGSVIKPDYKDFNDMWKKIKSGSMWYRPSFDYGIGDGTFGTQTGKFEFYSKQIERISGTISLEKLGVTAHGNEAFMPHYESGHTGEEHGHFGLKLVPYELINISSEWLPNPPYANKTIFDDQLRGKESFADINPSTAIKYGLKQGDRVYLESHTGKAMVRINLFDGAMPGFVYLPMGLGHTAYNDFSKDKGVNPNMLIHAGKDPLSGHPVWWDTPVRLTKV